MAAGNYLRTPTAATATRIIGRKERKKREFREILLDSNLYDKIWREMLPMVCDSYYPCCERSKPAAAAGAIVFIGDKPQWGGV